MSWENDGKHGFWLLLKIWIINDLDLWGGHAMHRIDVVQSRGIKLVFIYGKELW